MKFYVEYNARNRAKREFETRTEARRFFNELVSAGVKCIHLYYGSFVDGFHTLDSANY